MSKKNQKITNYFYEKTTSSNYRRILKEILKVSKQKDWVDRLIGNADQVQLFNLRDIVEPLMALEDTNCEGERVPNRDDGVQLSFSLPDNHSMEEYQKLLGISPVTGELIDKTYTIPYNTVFVETENTEKIYCGLLFLMSGTEGDLSAKVYATHAGKNKNDFGLCELTLKIDDNGEYKFPNDFLFTLSDDANNPAAFFMSRILSTFSVFRNLNDTQAKGYNCYAATPDWHVAYTIHKKRTIKINARPTYIILNKKDENRARSYSNTPRAEIKYSFSWVVRGHYRTMKYPNHLGKDRFGNRVLKGRTWIDTFVKGDQNLPIKQREKVVLK